MIKYMAAAVVLKMFSMNSFTRSCYRSIGNRLGQEKRRQRNIDKYIERGDLLVELAKKYGFCRDGVKLVELGTGWMHWFGIYLSLHIDGDSSLELYDVWDNRQLDALKSSFGKLEQNLATAKYANDIQREKLTAIQAVKSFEEFYDMFNARYTIDSDGSLVAYPANTYDAITSFHVMEHIGRSFIDQSVNEMYRMLKPGGYCVHQIGIDDHLAHYDGKISKKNYLRYSLTRRKLIFENVVQYHNALQCSDYLGFFEDAGFEVIETDREHCDISDLDIHADWKGYPQEDLETTIFTIICKKPD